MKKDKNWWKHGIIYHIYVRSFFDSNGDGIGDLPGVIRKLDYIKNLGISAIWLSPVFKSPMVDFGYDISDYLDIDAQYGSKKDLSLLIKLAHKRNIRVVLDIALNHTSDQHPWFLESRSSTDNPKRDWYIWRQGRWGGPPNNWITGMFEPAWKYDPVTKEYYLHSFLKNQPDLNWRNKKVEKTMLKILETWMDLGIDGFRLDMVNWLIKDKKMRNNPNFLFFKIFQKQVYNKNQKKITPLLKKIRKTADQYPEKVTIGEVFTMPPGDPELSAFFLGNGQNSLHMAFDFSLMYRRWNSRVIFRTVKKWIDAIPPEGWPCHVFSNHDQKRSYTRLCKGKNGEKKARILAVLQLTLPGTPFIYYGEEIGMRNFRLNRKDIKDPLGIKFWPFFKGRDSSRSPMQWNNLQNSGFTTAPDSWINLHPDYKSINVEDQLNNPDSLLNQYKILSKLRRKNQAFLKGTWEPILDGNNGIIAYNRKYKKRSFVVILNFERHSRNMANFVQGDWHLVYSSCRAFQNGKFKWSGDVHPYEALIIKLPG